MHVSRCPPREGGQVEEAEGGIHASRDGEGNEGSGGQEEEAGRGHAGSQGKVMMMNDDDDE